MRLHKIVACVGAEDGTLSALAFTLKSATHDPPLLLQLNQLGQQGPGQDCREFILGAGESVSYLEVTHGEDLVHSVLARVGSQTNVVFGARQNDDETKGWSFNEDNQLIGLLGSASDLGIHSLGVLIYDQKCAQQALGQNG